MTEVFDSAFHKRYVDGSGIVIDKGAPFMPKNEVVAESYEEILAQYRKYINDPKAELPKEILDQILNAKII